MIDNETLRNKLIEKSEELPKQLSSVGFWMEQLDQGRKEFREWWDQCERTEKEYNAAKNQNNRHMNVLWANTQVIIPMLYSKLPVPYVERRYKDRDSVGRVAGQMLQRSISTQMDSYDFDSPMKKATFDFSMHGRGCAWGTYKPTFGAPQADPNDPTGQATFQPVVYEAAECEYVHWRDFMHSPAQSWTQVWWISRRGEKTFEDLVKLGVDPLVAVRLNYSADEKASGKDKGLKKVEVWEIWCNIDRKVRWVADGHKDEFLLELDDPMNLPDFWPCPRPMYTLLTNSSLVPMSDFAQYETQAKQLEEVTKRINALVKQIRVLGVYDSQMGPKLKQIFSGTGDKLEPVEEFGRFITGGGFVQSVAWMPIEPQIQALKELLQTREAIKRDIQESSGIADIVRSQSVPGETATAQRLKSQYASIRIDDRKREVARFIRDVVRNKAEIITNMFDDQIIVESSGIMFTEEKKELIPPALQLLRNDVMRHYRIDIETNSMVEADQAEEKQQRMEFLKTMGEFLGSVVPLAQAEPALVPVIAQSFLWTVRSFPAARQLEAAAEQAADMIMAKFMAPQPGPGGPQAPTSPGGPPNGQIHA